MKSLKDLEIHQQMIYYELRNIYIKKNINKKDFLISLGVLINDLKYKDKGG